MSPPWRYRLLLRALSPLLLGYTLWRASRDGGWRYLRQRLGICLRRDQTIRSAGRGFALWVHAASVGEVLTVLPLLKAWQARHPDQSVLFTTNTPTGAAVLARQSISNVHHRYLPLDFPGATSRFLSHCPVARGWIVETEIWPWLYDRCARQQLALTIINGRLSERTLSQANGLLASSYRRALHGVRVLAKSARDAEHFMALGADPTRVQAAGNLKLADAGNITDHARPIRRDYVLAASTHDDEEFQLARTWLMQDSDDLLVIVPRHPERGSALQAALSDLGVSVTRRASGEQPGSTERIHLGDTLGEMQAWYQHAKAAFVGGSLIRRGGHNMLEPLAHACPTVTGAHTQNFDDIMHSLREADAITEAETAEQVVDVLLRAASGDPALREQALRGQVLVNQGEQLLQHYLQQLE